MARSSRSYPGKAAPSAPAYLPSYGIGGPYGGMGGMMGGGDPVTKSPGKGAEMQHMGSVLGKRGAGNSQITGGDPGAHAMNHYKKGGITGLR
jgi:hypothetical protein